MVVEVEYINDEFERIMKKIDNDKKWKKIFFDYLFNMKMEKSNGKYKDPLEAAQEAEIYADNKMEAIQRFQEAIESLQIEELEKTMRTLDELGISLYDSKNQYKPFNQVLQEIVKKVSEEENQWTDQLQN